MQPQQRVTTLPNGLRVVTVALPHLHSASVVMYARVGSRYESPEDNGLSHFLEHMLFRGTAKHPTSWDLNFAIESLGGTLHAETGRDYSLYEIDLDPECLAEGVELLGEIFRAPRFGDIELERKMILEELNEDLDDEGRDTHLGDIGRGMAFPDHPLGQKITGPVANVERFTVDDVRRHFARFYTARNMILAVSGPVEHDAIVAIAASSFGVLPSGEQAVSSPPTARPSGPRFEYVSIPGSQTGILLLFRAPAETEPTYPALAALSRALDDGMATPLHYTLCDQLGLAYYVSAGIEPFHDTGLFELDGASSHASCAELARQMLGLCARMRDVPVTDAELAKLKRRYRRDLRATLDDAPGMAGWFGGTRLFYEPPSLEEKLARFDLITAAEIQEVARDVFRSDTLIVAAGGGLSKAQRAELERVITSWR